MANTALWYMLQGVPAGMASAAQSFADVYRTKLQLPLLLEQLAQQREARNKEYAFREKALSTQVLMEKNKEELARDLADLENTSRLKYVQTVAEENRKTARTIAALNRGLVNSRMNGLLKLLTASNMMSPEVKEIFNKIKTIINSDIDQIEKQRRLAKLASDPAAKAIIDAIGKKGSEAAVKASTGEAAVEKKLQAGAEPNSIAMLPEALRWTWRNLFGKPSAEGAMKNWGDVQAAYTETLSNLQKAFPDVDPEVLAEVARNKVYPAAVGVTNFPAMGAGNLDAQYRQQELGALMGLLNLVRQYQSPYNNVLRQIVLQQASGGVPAMNPQAYFVR